MSPFKIPRFNRPGLSVGLPIAGEFIRYHARDLSALPRRNNTTIVLDVGLRVDVALGIGQINIPEVLKAAKAVGIQHYFIEDESPYHAAQIPVTIAYIKGLRK